MHKLDVTVCLLVYIWGLFKSRSYVQRGKVVQWYKVQALKPDDLDSKLNFAIFHVPHAKN